MGLPLSNPILFTYSMKPILVTSVLLAIFAATIKYNKKTVLYYFDVIDPYIPSSGVVLYDEEVQIRPDPFANPGDICSGYSYLCIVGFEASELTSGRMHLKSGPRSIYAIESRKY